MVGITDAPCRELAVELGAGLVCTEMVASEAVVRSQEASLHLLDFPGGVSPAGAQLVGCDPAVMADAAQVCVERGAVTVDVNLGCPVKKVVGRGSGAALARDVHATAAVLRAMVDAVDVPVTAKMRLGWDAQSINAPELARALADVGVAAVTVHGRTRCQGYAGEPTGARSPASRRRWTSRSSAAATSRTCVCIERRIRGGVVDGVVIARGMLGNFWLIRQATHLLATGELLDDLDFAARIELCRRHLAMLIAYHGAAARAAHRPQVRRLVDQGLQRRRAPARHGPGPRQPRHARHHLRAGAGRRPRPAGLVPPGLQQRRGMSESRLGAPVELPWWVIPLGLPPLAMTVAGIVVSSPRWAHLLAVITSLALLVALAAVAHAHRQPQHAERLDQRRLRGLGLHHCRLGGGGGNHTRLQLRLSAGGVVTRTEGVGGIAPVAGARGRIWSSLGLRRVGLPSLLAMLTPRCRHPLVVAGRRREDAGTGNQEDARPSRSRGCDSGGRGAPRSGV